MELKETLRKIKTELRLSMNGVASAYMRESGMNYKVNFGVEIPRLREIAAGLPEDHQLAQALWKEDIRECKLLADSAHRDFLSRNRRHLGRNHAQHRNCATYRTEPVLPVALRLTESV